MDFPSTVKRIKECGYWQISFYPTKPVEKLASEDGVSLTLPQLKQVILDNKVQYRGWDYPHCPPQDRTLDNQGVYNANQAVEAWIDWEIYQEVWRFHQSGKFTHLKGLHEDRYNEVNYNNSALQGIKPNTVLDVPETTYTLTEVFAFLRDLMQTPYFLDGIYLSITLKGTKNRKLTVLDPSRIGVFQDYECFQDDVPVFVDRKLSNKELRSDFKELAKEAALSVFHQFNWDAPPEQVIAQDQTKLLERKWF
jgi:hypothetical protein